MDIDALEKQIKADLADDHLPFLVVGTAGTVGIGATDPLPEIAVICKEYNLWFHVDGAYGAPAVVLPDASIQLKGLREARLRWIRTNGCTARLKPVVRWSGIPII